MRAVSPEVCVCEGGTIDAHDMRTLAPLYKVERGDWVYNIRERSFEGKGVHPDQMPASCVSVLSSRGKYSG